MNWKEADTDKIRNFDVMQFAAWLKEGLEMWFDPQRIYLAFEPVGGRFDPTDEIGPQLVDMAQVLPPTLQRTFLQALTATLEEAKDGKGDEFLPYSLQYIYELAKGRGMIS